MRQVCMFLVESIIAVILTAVLCVGLLYLAYLTLLIVEILTRA
jgi:hypothetical protein